MQSAPALARWTSLLSLGAIAMLLFVLAFGPQPSIYAG